MDYVYSKAFSSDMNESYQGSYC